MRKDHHIIKDIKHLNLLKFKKDWKYVKILSILSNKNIKIIIKILSLNKH